MHIFADQEILCALLTVTGNFLHRKSAEQLSSIARNDEKGNFVVVISSFHCHRCYFLHCKP